MRRAVPALALLAIALIAYANSFEAGLVVDNSIVIARDPRLREVSLDNLRLILTENYWWPATSTNLYRPLTTLSFWFNYAVLGHGVAPFGYHVVNFLLHAANAILLWRLARCLDVAAPVAWLAAALFAVHPLGVEAVTNIVGRSDLLVALSVLGTALGWLRAEAAANRRAAFGWRVLAGTTALLAVFAKEHGLLAPVAVGLLLWRQHGFRQGLVVGVKRALPVFAPALAAAVAVRWAMETSAPPFPAVFVNNPIAHAGPFEGALTALKVMGRSLLLVVWPATLSCDYSYPQIPIYGEGGWEDVQSWLALAAIVAGLVALWRRRATFPWVAGGVAWGLVMMLPTSNLFLRIGSIMADRFLYLPLTGFALALAAVLWRATEVLRARAPRLALALPVVVLGALSARTLVRNADWRDELSIWEAAARACPRSFNAHRGVAVALFKGGKSEADLDAAIARMEPARALLESRPLPVERRDHSLWLDLGHFYRLKGELVLRRGAKEEARQWFERGFAILERAYAFDRWAAGEARRRWRALGRAEDSFREVGHVQVHVERVIGLLHLDRVQEGLDGLRLALRVDPASVDVRELLGVIDRSTSQWEPAAVRYLQILFIERSHRNAWDQLNDIYRRLGIESPLATDPAGNRRLNPDHPRVRAHVNTAFLDLVRTSDAARFTREARIFQRRAIEEFGCPPELFAK